MTSQNMETELCQELGFDAGPGPFKKPKVVGIYGVAGCGKTFLLDQLKQTMDLELFSFHDGSKVIDIVTPGGLKAFQDMEEPQQLMYRQRATDGIRAECCESQKVGIVAGHAMLWSDEEGKALPIYTQNDHDVFTHILYLDVPADIVAQRRLEDTGKVRSVLTATQLEEWKKEEKTQLRRLCRDHDILFLALHHPFQTDKVSAFLKDFEVHSEDSSLSLARKKARKCLTATGIGQRIVLAMDADRTLAAEDTGMLFWTAASKKWPSLADADTLKTLFGGSLGYSYTAFRQATLLCEEIANDQDFEEICGDVASQVSMYPDIISLLHYMAEQDHLELVVITSGLRSVWEKVLEREGLSKAVTIVGGGRIADGLIVTAAVKAHLVGFLRERHRRVVWAIGDGPLDLPMLIKADRAIVIVGEELTRSKQMDAELKTAIDDHGLQAYQVTLPSTASPRNGLPNARLTDSSVVSNIMGHRWTHSRPQVNHATDTSATKLLATPMRNSAVAGPELREAHRRVGHHLATTFVADIIGLEQPPIQHVLGRETRGYQLQHEKKTTIVALMRGGEPMASGVNDAFPHAMFVHAKNPGDVKMHHLEGQLTLILVDSVINTGKSIVNFIQYVRNELHATIHIVVVAGVVQAKCVTGADGGTLVQQLASFARVHIVALRLSETAFVGSRQTDTGNRLFNTTHLP
ncbi:MAG: hypothetical protein L6R42_006475 [Xanthoria sp. 1 TBL-2021]|nr:MAG: hypothetical protein L6R42_006475 [Xanthoria sp. 1 TBL-2021]